jgi:transcription elongation factor Elf1
MEFQLDTVKTCIKCGEVKSILEFAKDCKSKGGYRNSCKICHAKFAKPYIKGTGRDEKYKKYGNLFADTPPKQRGAMASKLTRETNNKAKNTSPNAGIQRPASAGPLE